jgi:hypothetical protein
MSEMEDYRSTIINGDAFGTPGYAENTVEIYWRHEIFTIPYAGKREMGWEAVSHYLRSGEDGTPRLKVFDTCKHLIQTLPSLVRDSKNKLDVDQTRETATVDDLRYILQTIRDQKTPPPESEIQRRLRVIKELNDSPFDYSYTR